MTTYGHIVSQTELDRIDPLLGDRFVMTLPESLTYPDDETPEPLYTVVLPSINETMFSHFVFALPDSATETDIDEALVMTQVTAAPV